MHNIRSPRRPRCTFCSHCGDSGFAFCPSAHPGFVSRPSVQREFTSRPSIHPGFAFGPSVQRGFVLCPFGAEKRLWMDGSRTQIPRTAGTRTRFSVNGPNPNPRCIGGRNPNPISTDVPNPNPKPEPEMRQRSEPEPNSRRRPQPEPCFPGWTRGELGCDSDVLTANEAYAWGLCSARRSGPRTLNPRTACRQRRGLRFGASPSRGLSWRCGLMALGCAIGTRSLQLARYGLRVHLGFRRTGFSRCYLRMLACCAALTSSMARSIALWMPSRRPGMSETARLRARTPTASSANPASASMSSHERSCV